MKTCLQLKFLWRLLLVVLVLLLFTIQIAAANPSAEIILFGFFNRDGDRLITLGPVDITFELQQPQVIFASNQRLEGTYTKTQQKSAISTNRHTAGNFDHLAGHILFVNGPGPANQSALLAETAFFNERQFPQLVNREDTGKTLENRQRIAEFRHRSVANSWPVMQTDDGTQLQLVLFEQLGDQALASLVLFRPDRILCRDFPATYNPISTWRVDDGGVIRPEQFRILYLAKHQGIWEFAYEFIGAEGINLEFVRENQAAFTIISRASRYMSPF